MEGDLDFYKRKLIYNEELSSIENIKFTLREIDIISSVVHNRGEKKIALLLSISPRTVSTHLRNIMLKLNCNSRETIIDFIEKSGKSLFIKNYYLCILSEASFFNQLSKIGKTIIKQPINYYINDKLTEDSDKYFFEQLQQHLKLANINITDNQNIINKLHIITKQSTNVQTKEDNVFLVLSKNDDFVMNENSQHIDFTIKEQYYKNIFKLIAYIAKPLSINNIIENFEKEYNSICQSSNIQKSNLPVLRDLQKNSKKKLFIILFFSFAVIATICVYFYFSLKVYGQEKILSDLPLPHKNVLLNRSEILDKIKNKFSNKHGIETVVLVGIGGSGKTTIAYQYARKQKISLSWKLNAENKDNLMSSFEQLTYHICDKESDKNELKLISQIKDISEREDKLLMFLSKKIKQYPNWLLIFNNVETFKDIQKYFPHDSNLWGDGKIIITTCNSNIAHNSFIPTDNIIIIDSLNTEEKLELFNKIMNKKNSLDSREEDIKFLDKIPPFPLDIATAAYYIKEENITYNEYLQNISEHKEGFISIQESILNDIGDYNKTRYDIIILAIKKIINQDPNFTDLLLFISMIDYQNITRELLCAYKDNSTVSKLIHQLKNFSFIEENFKNSQNKISIDPNMQKISLRYLVTLLNLDKTSSKEVKKIGDIFCDFIDQHIEKKTINTVFLINHIEKFLTHDDIVNDIHKYRLLRARGIYYFDRSLYTKSIECFKKSLDICKKCSGDKNSDYNEILARLGSVYRNMGEYYEAKKCYEEAFNFYKTNYGVDSIQSNWTATYVGSIYRNIGQYKKSIELLNKTLIANKKYYGEDSIETARNMAYLGSSYKNFSEYKTAKELLEKALAIYKKHYGENHVQTAWLSVHLGSTYSALGEYENAKKLIIESVGIYKKDYGQNVIETAWSLCHLGTIHMHDNPLEAKNIITQSLEIYRNHFKESHINIAWMELKLAQTYLHLHDYIKSERLLKKTLITYTNFYGQDHIQTAYILKNLADIYILQNNLEMAENSIKQSLEIFKKNSDPDIYLVLESLTDLNIKKAANSMYHNKKENSEYFTNEAIISLREALKVLRNNFPSDSSHIARVKSKLIKLGYNPIAL